MAFYFWLPRNASRARNLPSDSWFAFPLYKKKEKKNPKNNSRIVIWTIRDKKEEIKSRCHSRNRRLTLCSIYYERRRRRWLFGPKMKDLGCVSVIACWIKDREKRACRRESALSPGTARAARSLLTRQVRRIKGQAKQRLLMLREIKRHYAGTK